MATKTAQIIIDIDDKSLVELNTEIKTLEQSMQNLKVGTQDWIKANQKLGQLKTQFQQATREAVKMQQVVEKVSGAEQLRSIGKLGQGLVGTFASVSGAVTLLGGNKKAFEEITAKAASFLQVMSGLNAISETFSAANLKGLKNVGQGFVSLVSSVKTASTGIKAALVTTGIGALVVAVGLLIANFDKISKLFDRSSANRIKNAETENQLAQNTLKQYEARAAANQKALDLVKEQNKVQEDAYKIANQIFNNAIDDVNLASQKIDALKHENELIDAQLKGDKKLTDLEKLKLDGQKHANEETIRGLEFDKIVLKNRQEEAYEYTKIAKTIQENSDAIKKNENALIVLTSQIDKQQAIYLKQLDTINKQIANINELKKANGELTKEQQQQLDTLTAQKTALFNQNEERKRQLKIQLDALGYERSLQKAVSDTQAAFKEINAVLKEQENHFVANTKGLKDNLSQIEGEKKLYEDIKKQREAILDTDTEGLKIFDENNKAALEIIGKYKESVKIIQDGLDQETAKRFGIFKIGKDQFDQRVKDAAQEILYIKQIGDATVAKLQNDKVVLGLKKEQLIQDIKEVELLDQINANEQKYYQDQLKVIQKKLEGNVSDEERKTLLEQTVTLEAKLQDLATAHLDNKQKIVDVNDQIVATDEDILGTNQDINKSIDETVQKTADVNAQVEEQARSYERLQGLVGKYEKEIDVSRQVIAQSIEFLATLQERKAEQAQKRIDDLTQQMDDLNTEEEKRKERLLDLEKELQDANGERYDEIRKAIEDEKKLETEKKALYDADDAARLKAIADRNKAENKAAKLRKAQAIIDAIIAGALAVVKALPNVFLSVATGVLAAASVATIVAQKIPDPPTEGAVKSSFARGGVQSNDGLTLVGEEGPEIAKLPIGTRVYSHQDTMRMLAGGAQVTGAYATGGVVGAPNLSLGGGTFIDYDKMTESFLSAVLQLPRPQLDIVKAGNAIDEVHLTKKLAGLSR